MSGFQRAAKRLWLRFFCSFSFGKTKKRRQIAKNTPHKNTECLLFELSGDDAVLNSAEEVAETLGKVIDGIGDALDIALVVGVADILE